MSTKQLLSLAMTIALPLLAQSGTQQSATPQPTTSVEQQISVLEEQSRLAASKNDPSFLKQYATGDYLVIAPDGSTMTKRQAVLAIIAGDVHYQSLEYINTPKVRTYGGNTAIVNAEASAELTSFGQPVSGTFRFMRVWVKQNGDWKIALFHATPEQPEKE